MNPRLDSEALLDLIRATLGPQLERAPLTWHLRATPDGNPVWRARAATQGQHGYLEFAEEDGRLFCAELRRGRSSYMELRREEEELKTIPVAACPLAALASAGGRA